MLGQHDATAGPGFTNWSNSHSGVVGQKVGVEDDLMHDKFLTPV
jgi:hypothetical protein